MSSGVYSATRSASKPSNAFWNPGHFALTTSQLMPAWNTDFVITSR